MMLVLVVMVMNSNLDTGALQLLTGHEEGIHVLWVAGCPFVPCRMTSQSL